MLISIFLERDTAKKSVLVENVLETTCGESVLQDHPIQNSIIEISCVSTVFASLLSHILKFHYVTLHPIKK